MIFKAMQLIFASSLFFLTLIIKPSNIDDTRWLLDQKKFESAGKTSTRISFDQVRRSYSHALLSAVVVEEGHIAPGNSNLQHLPRALKPWSKKKHPFICAHLLKQKQNAKQLLPTQTAKHLKRSFGNRPHIQSGHKHTHR